MGKKNLVFELTKFYNSIIFVLNNWTEAEYTQVVSKFSDANYYVIGKEVGENGTPHLQGYVYFKTKKRGSTLKKINDRIHWEPMYSTPKQASDYCKKDNNFVEFGELPMQGHRTDIDEICDEIKSGKKVDDICIERPMMFHQYGRTLTKVEDLMMRKKYRTEMTTCDWYWGETGTGKSHVAFKNYSPETHYVFSNDNGWWDKYTQQDIVIFNDFRGADVAYNHLLQLIDKWPTDVRRRGKEPMPFISKHIIITSSLPPEKVYTYREEQDKIEQLLRRIKVHQMKVCLCQKCSER